MTRWVTPISSRPRATGAKLPAMDITVPGSQCPALLARLTCFGWCSFGMTIPLPPSNPRWRYSSRPNIMPHSHVGSISGAPSTFSMTNGTPDSASTGRNGKIRSWYRSRTSRGWQFIILDQGWHGPPR